jgi:hypothetical protein
LDSIYEGEMELSVETECCEKRYETQTVADQREYQMPTTMLRVDRMTYDGKRLEQIDFVEDDCITRNNETTTSTGTPQYYVLYNGTIFLRPTPSEVKDLVIYCITEPTVVTLLDTLNVPSRYHVGLIDLLLANMFAKDGNQTMAGYHQTKWASFIARAKRWEMKRRVTDRYPQSKAEEFAPYNLELY